MLLVLFPTIDKLYMKLKVHIQKSIDGTQVLFHIFLCLGTPMLHPNKLLTNSYMEPSITWVWTAEWYMVSLEYSSWTLVLVGTISLACFFALLMNLHLAMFTYEGIFVALLFIHNSTQINHGTKAFCSASHEWCQLFYPNFH